LSLPAPAPVAADFTLLVDDGLDRYFGLVHEDAINGAEDDDRSAGLGEVVAGGLHDGHDG
jgi:hypothetical protein